ncbi:unnamed protein product [Prunus armeniaca]|nr:hypothetical protein GBA52_024316 [Prunus armeniaca]
MHQPKPPSSLSSKKLSLLLRVTNRDGSARNSQRGSRDLPSHGDLSKDRSEGRRFSGGFDRERKVGFSCNGGADSDNWGRKKESNGGLGEEGKLGHLNCLVDCLVDLLLLELDCNF